MENIFKKISGVFLMESDNADFKHLDETEIKTKYGKVIEVIVWKKIGSKDGKNYYSVIRGDGLNRSAWLAKKAERRLATAEKLKQKSDEYYDKSRKDHDFLVLGEPIKVGHHSEKRHRRAIEEAQNNMSKSCLAANKAREYEFKAETLQHRLEKEINLDTPESVGLLVERLEYLERQRQDLKNDNETAPCQLKNLGANIRRYRERLETAKKLWEL